MRIKAIKPKITIVSNKITATEKSALMAPAKIQIATIQHANAHKLKIRTQTAIATRTIKHFYP